MTGAPESRAGWIARVRSFLARSRVKLVLLGLPAAALGWALMIGATPEEETVPVRRLAEIEHVYEAFGTVAARESTPYFSPVEGRAAKVLHLVEEGRRVEPGEVLARLDPHAVQEELRERRLELANLRDELESLRTKRELGRAEAERKRSDMAAELEAARTEVEDYRRVEAPLEELELANRVEGARVAVEEAGQRVRDVREFLDKGYASNAELERASAKLAAARSTLEEGKERLRLFREVKRDREAEKRARRVAELEGELASVEDRLTADQRLSRSRDATLEARISELEQVVAGLEAQAEGCTVRVEEGGIAVHGVLHDEAGTRRKVQVGDLVWSNVVLVEVSALDRLDLEVAIPEEELHAIGPGLPARVWLTPEPLVELSGRVRRVGALSDEAGLGRVVQVDVELLESPEWVRPGMSGRSRILVRRFEDALVVPFTAVGFGDSGPFLRVQRLWGTETLQIEVLGLAEEGVVVEGPVSRGTRVLRRPEEAP